MNGITKIILGVIGGIVIGAGGVMAFSDDSTRKVSDHGEHVVESGNSSEGMQAEMDGMLHSLEGKTGDPFDQAFLQEMIVHHEGAVAMAEAALQNAAHQEIKDLAQAIISAQNSEITQMREWRSAWYGQ